MEPLVLTDHAIKDESIDKDAFHIIKVLQDEGFTAYLVGGSVRDLLSNKRPKDFDVSTSAKPEEIKHLFRRNCILIGRRFRLAHIRFGKKIIEVSTFRSGDDLEDSDLIVRDNEYGTPEEDVLRRDFTINGLFYDPLSKEVIDYVGGCKDIDNHLIRAIGPAKVRFMQDPVRMIRLLKFRARFGYHVEPEAMEALLECKDDILKSSQARILEEIMRMLESGYAYNFFALLFETGFLAMLFPILQNHLENHQNSSFFSLLKIVDETHQNPRATPIDRSVLSSCLIYSILEKALSEKSRIGEGPEHMGQAMDLTQLILNEFVESSFPKIPKRIRAQVAYILNQQIRLGGIANSKRFRRSKMLKNPDFPFSLGLLRLRSKVYPELEPIYKKWKDLFFETNQYPYYQATPYPKRRPSRRRKT